MSVTAKDFEPYIGLQGKPLKTAMPLEKDTLRRFAQAIMDRDPLYFNEEYAAKTAFKKLVAPPLYPAHAFRTAADAPDPLVSVQEDPNADGTAGNDGMYFGLDPIPMPFKRLLNGGNEIEFFRCLEVGERCVAQAKYANIVLKEGKNGQMLLVDIETTFRTEVGDLLLINRQTLIWR